MNTPLDLLLINPDPRAIVIGLVILAIVAVIIWLASRKGKFMGGVNERVREQRQQQGHPQTAYSTMSRNQNWSADMNYGPEGGMRANSEWNNMPRNPPRIPPKFTQNGEIGTWIDPDDMLQN